jgi:hypothetical protein
MLKVGAAIVSLRNENMLLQPRNCLQGIASECRRNGASLLGLIRVALDQSPDIAVREGRNTWDGSRTTARQEESRRRDQPNCQSTPARAAFAC